MIRSIDVEAARDEHYDKREQIEKEALEKISKHVEKAKAELLAAQKISDEIGVSFNFSIDGRNLEYVQTVDGADETEGWVSSSDNC